MESTDNENFNAGNSARLSTEIIQNLIDNYRSNQLTFINEKLGIDDAHSIWFDLVTLKKFIAEIEEAAQNLDSPISEEDLGVRFYYAAYPEIPQEPIPENFSKKHTLVMVPTKKEQNQNYDFNPFESEENALAITGRMAMAQNHGDLVPPGSTNVESY
ncbi:hypothetical protein PFY12_11765 [Chryseobacterium camelliae]|uniref:Uncharacterized protein n=1 Tax=Chryseobacterium camelliae TaxID=1265445 RepID=A0ABY7QJB4_9FLAO|nr:hypothetical protein [Chryseobacterium camelliae]WBV59734.1 hypothetical protein PFY12_11765 [Chryseobacterium camelliae]